MKSDTSCACSHIAIGIDRTIARAHTHTHTHTHTHSLTHPREMNDHLATHATILLKAPAVSQSSIHPTHKYHHQIAVAPWQTTTYTRLCASWRQSNLSTANRNCRRHWPCKARRRGTIDLSARQIECVCDFCTIWLLYT